jgi:hypothetical protein
MAIGESGLCCCWIERPRRWLSGQLETNIYINNSKGHRVPHPACILNLTLREELGEKRGAQPPTLDRCVFGTGGSVALE